MQSGCLTTSWEGQRSGAAFRLIFERCKSSLHAVCLAPSRGSSPNIIHMRPSTAGFIQGCFPTQPKSSPLIRVRLERAEEVERKARKAVHMQGRVPSRADLSGARKCKKRPTPSRTGRLTLRVYSRMSEPGHVIQRHFQEFD
jgi:hypothetical protein